MLSGKCSNYNWDGVPSLSEELTKEIARVRALPSRNVSARFAIKYAEIAILSGDVRLIVNAINSIKAHK